jgi:hypothetical protein
MDKNNKLSFIIMGLYINRLLQTPNKIVTGILVSKIILVSLPWSQPGLPMMTNIKRAVGGPFSELFALIELLRVNYEPLGELIAHNEL